MTTRVTIGALLAACGPEPRLHRWAEPANLAHLFECGAGEFPSVGVYNPLRRQAVQILAEPELHSIEGGDDGLISSLFHRRALLVLLASSRRPPATLVAAARSAGVGLFGCRLDESRLLALLHHRIGRLFAPRRSVHGVLMAVAGSGTLIVGEPGSGKSSLALELLGRGHRLIADDCVELHRDVDGHLWGRQLGPERLAGFLFVRGLGMVDLRAEFGVGALSEQARVELVIRLTDPSERGTDDESMELELHGEQGLQDFLDVSLPCFRIRSPVAACDRVEACARRRALTAIGRAPADRFAACHGRILTATEGV